MEDSKTKQSLNEEGRIGHTDGPNVSIKHDEGKREYGESNRDSVPQNRQQYKEDKHTNSDSSYSSDSDSDDSSERNRKSRHRHHRHRHHHHRHRHDRERNSSL